MAAGRRLAVGVSSNRIARIRATRPRPPGRWRRGRMDHLKVPPVFGYHGRYLRIDLDDGSAERRPLSDEVLRRFIGGVGLAAWLLHREASAKIDPFDPAAPL